jgi:D-3-phosphoglycerate dehydrogenase
MKVLIAETKDFSHEAIAQLKMFAEVDLHDISQEQLLNALQQYDVFWFRLGFKLNADILQQATRCKFLVCPVTGLDHIDLDACKEKGIRVISLRGEVEFLKKVRATAELTLGLALTMLRNIHGAINHTLHFQWNRNLFKGREIYEKKVGIIGLGRLGQITASYFHSMGAEVYVYDTRPVAAGQYTIVDKIEQLFRECDIISLHVNMTEENRGMIHAAHFALLKQGSYFINTSRGPLVNSADLIEAIRSGHLAAAAVDVIENEYNHQQDILLQFAANDPRLIITPHIGGNTYESFAKTELFMVEKLKLSLS